MPTKYKSHKSKSRSKTKSSSNKSSVKKNKDTNKLIIKVPIGDKTAEFIDDYSMLDMTVKQAIELPEFEQSFIVNCKNTINKRTNTLL